jgi:hypothetical protein
MAVIMNDYEEWYGLFVKLSALIIPTSLQITVPDDDLGSK